MATTTGGPSSPSSASRERDRSDEPCDSREEPRDRGTHGGSGEQRERGGRSQRGEPPERGPAGESCAAPRGVPWLFFRLGHQMSGWRRRPGQDAAHLPFAAMENGELDDGGWVVDTPPVGLPTVCAADPAGGRAVAPGQRRGGARPPASAVVGASARGLPHRSRPPIADDAGEPVRGDAPSELPGIGPALAADSWPGGLPGAGGRSPAAGPGPRCRLSALAAAWLGLACVALGNTPFRLVDAVTFLTLLALAAFATLLTRPAGAGGWPERVRSLAVVWTLPVAVLLPPVYPLLVHLPLCLLPDSPQAAVRAPAVASAAVRGPIGWRVSARETPAGQWSAVRGRARRAARVWRVHDAFALGLAGLAASWLHRLVAGAPGPYTVSGLTGSPPRLAGLAAAAAGYALVRWLLVASTARLVSWRCEPALTAWCRAPRPDTALARTAELSAAVAVAVLWAANPLLMLAVVPSVLLLARSLPPDELLAAARTDAKTGLANVTFWREVADAELARARRAGRPLSVLLVDIDHFKQVNDRHGHLFGDTVLVAVADALRAATRPWDLVGRFGGEEFVVLLAEVDLATAAEIAERIRGQVAALRCPLDLPGPDGAAVSVTVSVGAAVCAPTAGLPAALEAADAALYRAKAEGRDRVRLAGTAAPEPAADGLGAETLGHSAVPAQAVQPD